MRTDETPGATAKEHKLKGIGVSPGIAIGLAYIGDRGELPVSESRIDEPQIEHERARFAEAVSTSIKQLRKLKTRAMALPGSAADEIGSVLDAHLAMLANSRLIRGVNRRIGRARINAERAIQLELGELGLPAVLGIPGLLDHARAEAPVIVDGTEGAVILDPAPETVRAYKARQQEVARERRLLNRLRRLPAVTRDGVEIELHANVELPVEVEQALANGAVGLGLVRTEFLYMNREDLPGEDEQYSFFAALVSGMEGRPVTLRTFDIGGDKLPEALAGYAASDIANPALGLRAIRLSLRDRRLLDVQLAAMLRAAARGPVRIMLPMVSTVSEVRRAREAMEQVSRRLRRRGVRIPDELPPLGAMVEVPAAALAADALAAEADFFAIGTNDLVQYTLAVDRSDETVADLYNPLHPAVLRLIQFAVEAAARRDIPISICGEIAGDPRYAALLLGLGLRQLSMSPRNIPRVKQRIRNLDMVAASRRVRAIMDQSDPEQVAVLLDDFNATVWATIGVG